MTNQCVRPLAGLATVVVLAVDRRARRRAVPRRLRRNRSGDGDLRPRRSGDEPRRQGQDARRAGGQGRRRSRTARRHGRAAPGDGSRSQMQLIPSNVLVDIASTTVFGAKFVQLVPPPDPSPQQLRAGQVIQSQHVTVEINTVFQQLVERAGQDRAREAQRDARRDRDGLQRPRREDRPDVGRLQRAAGQDRAEPAEPVSHDIEASPRAFTAYADAAPDLVSTRRERDDDQQHHRRPAAEPRRVPGQRNRSGRHRQRRGRRQPPGAHRCGAPAGAHHRPAQRVPRLDSRAASAGSIPFAQEPTAVLPGSSCRPASRWASSAIATQETCRRSRAKSGGANYCDALGLPDVADRTSCRRSWSATSAPTRRSTGTRASC